MSDEKHETIADIVAEMRNEGHTGDASCLEWVRAKMIHYADRIEAAAKREREATREKSSQVGNAAKMREALDSIYKKLETLDVEEDSYADDVIASVKSVIVEALYAPPRNCDVGTSDEQLKMFNKFCFPIKCSECKLYTDEDLHDCIFRWYHMPYEEGGAE